MCGDYRKINAATKPDTYVMPTAEEIFDRLGGSNLFSKLDCYKGYHQIEIAEADRPKTAFWGGKQLWQWKRVPFGLRNAGACFQRCMDFALRGIARTECYIDDILAYGLLMAWQAHINTVAEVLERLAALGLKCHPQKCEFGASEVEFLGHVVSEKGIAPTQSKVQAVRNIPQPTTVTEVKSFLGLAGYYRRCIPQFSAVAQPLTHLTKKNMPFRWGTEQEAAFQSLKDALTSASFLARPDYSRPFLVQTDWSVKGMGAILSQRGDDGLERVIEFASKSNSPSESSYSSYQGELLAVVFAVKHWRRYLLGRRFLLETDHQPLRHLMESGNLTGQRARWAVKLQEYDFEIKHRAGVVNVAPDALSRSPDPTGVMTEGAELHDYSPPFAPLTQPTKQQKDALALQAAAANYQAGAQKPKAVFSAVVAFRPAQALTAGLPQSAWAIPGMRTLMVFVTLGIAGTAEDATNDIWEDNEALQYIQTGVNVVGGRASPRVLARATKYRWLDGKLERVLADGSRRTVPPPEERTELAKGIHERYGHFGVRRTIGLLSPAYWWCSMWATVSEVVKNCSVCDRSKAGFNVRPSTLHPLPINGLGYRWNVDLFGELPETPEGFRYCMLCIEAFSKWVEAIPLRTKTAAETRDAFMSHVLARFGACAEVVTDQGSEFRGEFDELLQQVGIQHRTTSRNHPQADGLAERAVQTVKNCIRRSCDTEFEKWAEVLPWIVMGYRMSPQAALRFAPYYLLYGRAPVVPPAIRERMYEPLDFDCPEKAMQSVVERAALFRRLMPLALENLAVAAHQDTLRYALTRSGGYVGPVREFAVGEFVYIRNPAEDRNTLEMSADTDVFRIVEIRDTGVLVLQGRCGGVVTENVKNCAPCRAYVNGTIDPSLARRDVTDAGAPCQRCNETEWAPPDYMLLCDHCNSAWHMRCLPQPLKKKPAKEAPWFCPWCVRLGRLTVTLRAQSARPVAVVSYEHPADALAALRTLMPGPWTQGHATRLFHRMPGQRSFIQNTTEGPERVATWPEEYEPLYAGFRWGDAPPSGCVILDPWCGSGSTATQLDLWQQRLQSAAGGDALRAATVVLSDIDVSVGAHHHGNALDPLYLQRLRSEYGGVDVIITSPWFTMLDLALPVMVDAADIAVFCHCPGHYLTSMPEGRRSWFRRNADRLVVLSQLPVGPTGRRCLWICVFRTPALLRRWRRLPTQGGVAAPQQVSLFV